MMNAATYFKPEFIEKIMREHAPSREINVLHVTTFVLDSSASILTTLNAGKKGNLIGHYGLKVQYTQNGIDLQREMVMKIKPHGSVTSSMLMSLAQHIGPPLSTIYESCAHLTGFYRSHHRELMIYKDFTHEILPEIYGLYEDTSQNVFLILMECLKDSSLLNTVMQPEKWDPSHIKKALAGIAAWHAQHLQTQPFLNTDDRFEVDRPSLNYMMRLQPLWTGLLENASKQYPELYTINRTNRLRNAIKDIPQYWKTLQQQPFTRIHNDFNLRNVCFKERHGELIFCAYDWELATFHVPHYDVVEFLCFVLSPAQFTHRDEFIDHFRVQLHEKTGQHENADLFKEIMYYAALDFGLHRLGMYMMAHTVSPYPFLSRVVNNYFELISYLKPRNL